MKHSKQILRERKKKEKNWQQVKKSVHCINTGGKNRWIGWRTSEKPGVVTTYKIEREET